MARQLLLLLLLAVATALAKPQLRTTATSRMLHQEDRAVSALPMSLHGVHPVDAIPADDPVGASTAAMELAPLPDPAAAPLPAAAANFDQDSQPQTSAVVQEESTGGISKADGEEADVAVAPLLEQSVAPGHVEDVSQLLSGAIYVLQQPTGPKLKRCSIPDVPIATQAAVEAQLKRFTSDQAAAGVTVAAWTPVVIDTYFHVVANARGQGFLSDQQVRRQMEVLSAAFASAGISFTLRDTVRYSDGSVYTARMSSGAEARFKRSVRKGGASALNVYTWASGDSYLGWATFPWSYGGAASDDGVVIRHSTLPGGSAAPYNQGDTLVHEVRANGGALGLEEGLQPGVAGWHRVTLVGLLSGN
jgi:hypothetical protein